MRRRILPVFGTRPEAIKMAPLCHALRADDRFETVICVTAQHRQMLDQVLSAFDLAPDYDLDVMTAGQNLADVTSAVLKGMTEIIRKVQPEAVLIHGDTTTTLATAMASFYAGVPVGHVEAGLRTFDIQSPFPEEFNRQIASKIARWHFAPTPTSRSNLLREGIAEGDVHVTGNTVVDAMHWALRRIDNDTSLHLRLASRLDHTCGFSWRSDKFVLITGHRRENFGDGFRNICRAIASLSDRFPDVHFVYPVHLNPNVQVPVSTLLGGKPNVHLLEPLEYQSFLLLLRNAHLVLTDSGGIQEEAPGLGKPVLVMREVTERPEAVEAGTVLLVGADESRIVDQAARLLANADAHQAMARAHNPYGDGHACARIVDVLGRAW
jgi:UDP-N-acetylglucosamine 2-epimerase (non-hydrolysing)